MRTRPAIGKWGQTPGALSGPSAPPPEVFQFSLFSSEPVFFDSDRRR